MIFFFLVGLLGRKRRRHNAIDQVYAKKVIAIDINKMRYPHRGYRIKISEICKDAGMQVYNVCPNWIESNIGKQDVYGELMTALKHKGSNMIYFVWQNEPRIKVNTVPTILDENWMERAVILYDKILKKGNDYRHLIIYCVRKDDIEFVIGKYQRKIRENFLKTNILIMKLGRLFAKRRVRKIEDS